MNPKQVEKPIGTEHEYSINDQKFNPLPISDRIIMQISGALHDQVRFGEIEISKELQKHAIELIPARPGTLGILEDMLYQGLKNLYHALNYEYNFLGLGMHPLLRLDQTTYWDHNEREYYNAYDKLFNLKQHGWMNIQALQINIPYKSKEDLVGMFNRLRSLIPYVVAVSASSPFVEGRLTSYADNRLVFYRENQRRMPLICNDILPERIGTIGDYIRINKKIYSELRECGADVLCREWVNSRGVIVRFTRRCLEVKAIDEQECLRSDMAISAFLLALLRSDQELEEDENALRSMLEEAMMQGTKKLLPELSKFYEIACKNATREEKQYMPIIEKRINRGSLAEVMIEQHHEEGSIKPLLFELAESLKNNTPYFK